MARSLLYKRVVDAVLTCTSSLHDTKIENMMKIKDEPVDTITLNADITDTSDKNFSTLKNDMLSRNFFNMINRDESSLSVNDVSFKTVNNEKSEHIFNSHFAYVNGADKTLKRKRTIIERDVLSQSKKKRSNNFQISKNKNINAFTKTTEEEEKKQQSIKSISKTKIQHINQSLKKRDPTECNICFRKFSSVRNCENHKLCYNGKHKCKRCNRHFITRKKLCLHIKKCSNLTYNVTSSADLCCNFCNRGFRTNRALLQSHLFHVHSELISSNDIIKCKKQKSKNVNTHCKNNTLETDAHKELPSTNNFMKSEIQNTFINKNKSWNDDDVTKTDDKNLTTEELFNNGMLSKKLRQLTLTEYREFSNRKRDINASPNKFNIDYNIKNSFSSASSHNEKEVKNLKSKFSKIYNKQVHSCAKLNNLEQMIHSILEQDQNYEESKKPTLHADVEMMKSFLEQLPNTTVEDRIINDDIISYYHEIPYSLRSLRTTASTDTISNSRKKKSRDMSKKSQFKTELSTRTKHDVTDKIDSDFWKTIMARFKCKNCSIILTRCDEKVRNGHQIAETETTFKQNISLSSQCNSMLFQESDIRNKMVLKELEVSLERLATVSVVDIKKKKTEVRKVSEVEKCNDGSFMCKICKKSFSSKSDKHMHIKSSHIAYMSSICDARYKLKHKLLRHYLSEHLSKQNQCCVCYALLSDYVELKRHLSIHCLKYVWRENDQHPIDIEIKCASMKNNYKCFRCNMVFLTQSKLIIHQTFCILQEKITEDQKDFIKKISTFPKIIFEMQRSKNTDGLMVTHGEKNNFNKCLSKKSVKIKNKHQISLINEEDLKIAEEKSKINENKQNSSVNNDLVTTKIETINESQNSEKLLENDNSMINNYDITNAQVDMIKSNDVEEQLKINEDQPNSSVNNDLVIMKIINETQNSEKLLENDNSMISNHDIANAQVDIIKSNIVEEQSKINEDKQNSSDNNNSITRKIEIINESQNSKKLLKNDNSMVSNHNIANAKMDVIKSKITYPCDICGKQFHSHKNLQQHKRTFNNTTNYCSICCTGFSSTRLLQTHITAAHILTISKIYSFRCVFCNHGFTRKYELRSHILHLHGQEVLYTLTYDFRISKKKLDMHTAMCNICNLLFKTYDRYVDHKMFYYKNHTFTCSLCAQNFQGLYMFIHHNKLIHYSKDKRKPYNYICDICNEGFNLELHFYSHNMHVHSNEKNLTEITKGSEERSRCDACEVQKQISCSTNQRKEIEQSSNENICQICQLKCIDTNDLEKHIAFYSNDGDFKCDKCKRQCKTHNLLYEHKKLTHACLDIYNEHVCHVCGEVSETDISLECHKKHFHLNDIVHNNADDRKHCEQTSSNLNKLIKHRLKSNDIHNTVIYKFYCLFCNMKFFSAKTIQTHIIQTHIDNLFVKHNKSSKFIFSIKDDNTRKQFAPQLAKVDQASTSAAITTTSLATIIPTITPTSATTTVTPVSASIITLPSGAAAATITSTSVIATRYEDKYIQFLQNNISNNILDKNEIKGKTIIELPNQIKATFLVDNKIV